MSTFTNEPMLLDETGQMLLTKMREQNGYLAMLHEQQRDTVYKDISQIANIVRAGYGPKTFPIGDQIIIPWIDTDESVTYQVPHNIVSHGFGELRSGETVPVMFTQWDLNTPYGVQFSHEQAFYNVGEAGLPAGTYHIKFGATLGKAISGAAWAFTLATPVPSNGRLSGFESMDTVEPTSWKVKSWTLGSEASPLEEVSVTAGETGTLLGTLQLTTSTANLNSMQNTGRGNNMWSPSGFRQYLNKAGNNWFVPDSKFSIRPNEYAKKGFLSGYSDEVLAATKELKLVTALNTVEGHSAATETTYDRIFLPSLEQMNITPQLATVEGPHFEYWRRKLGLSGFAGTGSSNIYDAFKIPAVNNASPQYVRLRSAYRGHACYTWYVRSSGYVYYSYHASYSFRSLPVVPIS